MGFDCGFDIFPRLEVNAANMQTYQNFVDEVTSMYKDVHDKDGRPTDGKVLLLPCDPNNDFSKHDREYIWFMVGEWLHMPISPLRCNYFLRFSSKVSGRLTAPAEKYIEGVYRIAKKHLGNRVHFWHELNDTGEEWKWGGFYSWEEVYDAKKELRELGLRTQADEEQPGEAL